LGIVLYFYYWWSKFLEHKILFTLEMDSDIRDGFIGLNHEDADFTVLA
jgi:hypothetical protein